MMWPQKNFWIRQYFYVQTPQYLFMPEEFCFLHLLQIGLILESNGMPSHGSISYRSLCIMHLWTIFWASMRAGAKVFLTCAPLSTACTHTHTHTHTHSHSRMMQSLREIHYSHSRFKIDFILLSLSIYL